MSFLVNLCSYSLFLFYFLFTQTMQYPTNTCNNITSPLSTNFKTRLIAFNSTILSCFVWASTCTSQCLMMSSLNVTIIFKAAESVQQDCQPFIGLDIIDGLMYLLWGICWLFKVHSTDESQYSSILLVHQWRLCIRNYTSKFLKADSTNGEGRARQIHCCIPAPLQHNSQHTCRKQREVKKFEDCLQDIQTNCSDLWVLTLNMGLLVAWKTR